MIHSAASDRRDSAQVPIVHAPSGASASVKRYRPVH